MRRPDRSAGHRVPNMAAVAGHVSPCCRLWTHNSSHGGLRLSTHVHTFFVRRGPPEIIEITARDHCPTARRSSPHSPLLSSAPQLASPHSPRPLDLADRYQTAIERLLLQRPTVLQVESLLCEVASRGLRARHVAECRARGDKSEKGAKGSWAMRDSYTRNDLARIAIAFACATRGAVRHEAVER